MEYLSEPCCGAVVRPFGDTAVDALTFLPQHSMFRINFTKCWIGTFHTHHTSYLAGMQVTFHIYTEQSRTLDLYTMLLNTQ